jgi:predicted nucleic acid-binding protein
MNRKGCDSGFFILLGAGDPKVQQIWQDAASGQFELVMSVISINEVLVVLYRQGKLAEADGFRSLIYSSPWVHIVPVSVSIAEKSAGYRHGLGLSTVDSIILATAVEENCGELLTTDRHFVAADSQGIVKVTLLA